MDLKPYAAIADFGTALFKACLTDKENVLVSPLSLAAAMALVTAGAEKETKEELLQKLGGEQTEDEFHKFLSDYEISLPSDEKTSLHTANSIWVKKGIRVRRRFKKLCTELYKAGVTTLPFDEKAVKTINEWVSTHTEGMIDSVIDSASPEASLYLINALAFQGRWEKAYEEDQKEEGLFTALNGEKQEAVFLTSEENLYITNEKCTGFVKPYTGGNYAFMALLPPENADFEAYAASFTGVELMAMLATAVNRKADAFLPKFKGSWAALMNDALKEAGIKKIFTGEGDLTGITRGNTTVGEVIHKTFIEVDEQGTRAAAVTSVMTKMAALPEEKPEVRLDRPFVYAIMDTRYGVPLFLGQLISLKKEA